MNKERFFVYMPRVFILVGLLFSVSILKAADQCLPSNFSATLTSQSPTYSNSGSIRRGGSDTYYFSVSSAGTVTITVTSRRNNILFSYSDSICPNSGDSPASASATYTFTTASDFNLRVYRAGRGGGRRGGSYTIDVSFAPFGPIAEYRMDKCEWSGVAGEVSDEIGGDNNGTITGGNILTVEPGKECRAGEFVGDAIDISSLDVSSAAGEKSTVMFWMYWDGKTNVMPFGWSRYSLWMYGGGFGFNTSKGDIYGVPWSNLVGGWHHVTAIFTNNSVQSNKLYIDGVEQNLTQLRGNPDNSLAVVQSSARIGGWLLSDSYRFSGRLDELKIFKGEVSGAEVSQIYNNELNGLNYDGTTRVCGSCTLSMSKSAVFNTVDYAPVCNASINWDDNITTKVTGSGFDLSILAKDADTNLPMEANITRVDLYLYGSGDTSVCNGTPYAVTNICTNGCGTTDAAGCLTLQVPPSLNSKASRCVQVHIEGRDINSTLLDVNESNSIDNFALRPDSILFVQPIDDANLTAQKVYYYASALKGVTVDGATPAADYNTTLSLEAVKYMRSGEVNASLAGTLTAEPLSFSDGVADINFSFSDVAKLTLKVLDSGWAAVDGDDTPQDQRVLFGERNVTLIPSYFDLQFLSAPFVEDNDTTNRFTYLSNDLNMSAWARRLSVVVTAKGEAGSTLLNFSSPINRLFADPVDISPILRLPTKHSAAKTLNAPQPQSGVDINFTSGEAIVRYEDVPFNYDRLFDTPIDPFLVPGSEGNISVAVTDATYPEVNGSTISAFDSNATFYYGRLRTEDLATTEQSSEKTLLYEVYDSSASPFVSGFERSSLEWYINRKHDKPSSGRVVSAAAKESTALDSATDTDISIGIKGYSPGRVTLEINSSVAVKKSLTIHIDIDRWLWYAPKGFGLEYDYNSTSDCLSHPCLFYTLTPKVTGVGTIVSGDFNGSDFNASTLDANATFIRREGVKLFR